MHKKWSEYDMELVSRVSLIVYLKHIKHERQIRKYGHIVYTNKQRKYVVLYVNEQDADRVVHKLMKLKYVLNIDGSPYKYLKKTYEKEKHEML
ncbi:UPF0298 protein [Staphylococcus pragensis]|jgi:uncharacterized protein YlbG (UPF0298 family)|nr:UPF0298 protein [Staphylococcus pragensis]